ncbi:motile sperm domain-containing protein 2-like isoform X2 [Xenia sp. Carnegie-2017]|uniref:motile sperm domain-containing protein 2-like isoform X2 n=1 Tax=Xenia sp. Carnegie-2017 TaxID=2897299 RepID=UPI001F03B39D|nr:motile sperm domain-containing protein 2-like isoform X2 [Xenia sp. Carnegie-2017]
MESYQYCYPPNDDTQHPFQPLFLDDVIGLNGDGTFEDAIENIDSSDEMSQGSNARSSDTIKGSPETLVRKRFSRLNNLTPQSSIEVLPTEEECEPNELVISPNEEIIFCEEENFEDVQKTLSLKNVCERKVIYKIKTNSAANFRVRPSVGWLEPGATKEVTIILLSKAESNTEKQRHWSKNKFLILYAMHDEEISRDTSITELWKTIPKSCCKEYRLNCRILDRNGLEKRPRTIDDAIEMNLRLQKQLLELQNKMSNVTAPLETIQDQLLQQRKYFFLGISITILILVLFCFYLLR